MTEKRFECDKGSRIIIDNETKLHYIMTLDWECSLITRLLNHFAEENEQLKQFKKQVCNLIDTKIKHYEHKPISAPVSQPMSVNFDYDVDRLARLSELQDLKWELKMND